jgi:hypothetical protein
MLVECARKFFHWLAANMSGSHNTSDKQYLVRFRFVLTSDFYLSALPNHALFLIRKCFFFAVLEVAGQSGRDDLYRMCCNSVGSPLLKLTFKFSACCYKFYKAEKKLDVSKHKECVECEHTKALHARGMCE